MIDWVSHYAGDIGVIVGACWTCLSTFWAVKKHLECGRLRRQLSTKADYTASLAARASAAKAPSQARAGGSP